MTGTAAVIADIHGNREALAAVLAAVDAAGHGTIYCLGDLVGYGPDPDWCVETIRARKCVCLLGNHDAVAAGLRDGSDFSPPALQAMHWTRRRLSPEQLTYLAALPTRREVSTMTGNAHLVHASLVDDYLTYISTPEPALASLQRLRLGHFACIGHTHKPALWTLAGGTAVLQPTPDGWWEIPMQPVLLNPGSCGQPRDHDQRAAYLVWDVAGRRCRWERVAYDVTTTQQKMRDAGLPDFLAERLAEGR